VRGEGGVCAAGVVHGDVGGGGMFRGAWCVAVCGVSADVGMVLWCAGVVCLWLL